MSRSYKKPYYTDQNKGKPQQGIAKKRANRKVRKSEVGNGAEYKKHSCSWNIRDWRFYCPEDQKAKRK